MKPCRQRRHFVAARTAVASIMASIVATASAGPVAVTSIGFPVVFTNPILERGQDPWIVQRDGLYFYCRAIGNRIAVSGAPDLPFLARHGRSFVWQAPPDGPYSRDLWAPELHSLRGRWYIYVAADDGENANHRMYVLEGTTQDPRDPFVFRGQIADATNRWAIDGTVLEMPDGRLYFIWSGWEGDVNFQQNLYIAPMSGPTEIDGPRVLISQPEHAWERVGRPWVNEGPQALWSPDGQSLHIIYSASGSWTDDYCLGRLTWSGGDPLDPDSWIKCPEPVFSRTDDVFGPGHASFVTSHAGRRHWIVYHAAVRQGAGWTRDVRMQPFEWRFDATPDFGEPIPPGAPLLWDWRTSP